MVSPQSYLSSTEQPSLVARLSISTDPQSGITPAEHAAILACLRDLEPMLHALARAYHIDDEDLAQEAYLGAILSLPIFPGMLPPFGTMARAIWHYVLARIPALAVGWSSNLAERLAEARFGDEEPSGEVLTWN
jgi:DNA-directed RNA polymerase specialized sigma24 family protein